MSGPSFPALLQRFFTERLVTQQGASPYTVAGYRDTFRLLFRFATERLGRAPSALRLEELDAAFLEAFLAEAASNRRAVPAGHVVRKPQARAHVSLLRGHTAARQARKEHTTSTGGTLQVAAGPSQRSHG